MKLIDKDALVAEIKKRRDSFYSISKSCKKGTPAKTGFYAQAQTLEDILSFLDTIEVKLEVKEVDLEKESLTWKDIGTMDQLLWDLSDEYSGKSDNEGYYKAVLSRFKAQKVE